jgi:hypothetical protein
MLKTTLILALSAASLTGSADEAGPNQFTIAGRAAFGIKARFGSVNLATLSASTRTTPSGDPYNYDDGYVLTDSTGNFLGQTWYWGYDNASQISGNTIGLSRSLAAPAFKPSSFGDDPQFGGEIIYNRVLRHWDRVGFGLEAAGSYLNLNIANHGAFAGNVQKTTDFYPYTVGTTPPAAPYQGTYGGANFVIGDTPTSSTSSTVPGSRIIDDQKFDGNVWGLRLGPYAEVPLGDSFSLGLSAGPAAAVLAYDASWRYSLSAPGLGTLAAAGSGEGLRVLWGWYAGGKITWNLNPRWSFSGGAQYQSLHKFEKSIAGRNVELDLTKTIYVSVGLGYWF